MSLQCTSEKWSLTRISPMPVVQSSIVYTCIETVHMGHTTPEFTDRFTEGRCNVNVCNVQIMVINVYYVLDRKHTKTYCYYHLHVAQHSTTCMSNGPSMYTSIK